MKSPQFTEPWQAQVFGLVVALQERGVITEAQWADALGAAIRRAQAAGDPDTGETYYRHWVAALEALLAQRGVASHEALEALAHAWEDAARRTPHGQPIALTHEERAIARGRA
ncbi:MAG TPA: nitrile hydratase accessory protein [Ramlibacter sp.]|uniref:nitrile hydratase accessory protein n=1 Tax=Ramlibacter sp. TaxID=1917967 RepID=UPI002BADE570|nr:nitrile hydratase accessory protein [Ramlibacter sp.]HVZ46191.1 nitrile hydratase accessory protein [Ramlibacter sp.]